MKKQKVISATPAKSGRPWEQADIQELRKLAKQNTPTGLLAYKLQRTESSVRAKARSENISLMPPNRSPAGKVE